MFSNWYFFIHCVRAHSTLSIRTTVGPSFISYVLICISMYNTGGGKWAYTSKTSLPCLSSFTCVESTLCVEWYTLCLSVVHTLYLYKHRKCILCCSWSTSSNLLSRAGTQLQTLEANTSHSLIDLKKHLTRVDLFIQLTRRRVMVTRRSSGRT